MGTSTDKKIFKIAVFGDSVAYGLGVTTNQRYTDYLENYLNGFGIDGIEFDVYNYSQNGDDLLDHYVKYLKTKEFANFDLYILAMLANDVFIKRDDKYPLKITYYDKISSLCNGIPIEEQPYPSSSESEEEMLEYTKTLS